MMKIVSRIRNFVNRSQWLGKIIGSPYKAALYWVRIKFRPQTVANGRYGKHPFQFRGIDVPIVREIIHEQEYDFLHEDIKKISDPVILDVGAHIGLFSICMLNANPKAALLSVEPSLDTFALLQQNMQKELNWKAINRAAWDSNEQMKFDDESKSMSQRISKDGRSTVTGITLPELFTIMDVNNIDIMKVDIEGAEEAFLCAYPDYLDRVEKLVIELHREFCDVEKVKGLLEKKYKSIKYLKDRNSSRPVLYCQN